MYSCTYYVVCNRAKDTQAIKKLILDGNKSLSLSNKPLQIHFLGVLLLHHCFEHLRTEFSSFVTMITLDVDSSMAAFWSATKLGYLKPNKNIKHNLKSALINTIYQ